ncbi:tyrosine-type recombinase/integrase [Streptomyces halstedii]
MLPDGARERLLETANAARDRLVVTWLADGGLRIGELCGLHLVDLHLRENAACGECRAPYLHVCHRPGNPNRAEAKSKRPWRVEHGIVTGGLIKRVSPAMVHTYFEYVTTEHPRGAGHGMLLVQLHGAATGQPWAPVGARRMLGQAGKRAGLRLVKPHAFRHSFTSAVSTPPTATCSSPGTPAAGRRRRWWMRSTATSVSTTRSSMPLCARSGVRRSDGAVAAAAAGCPHATRPAGGAHHADQRARARPGAARRGAEDPADAPGLSVELHGRRLGAAPLAALRDVLGARRAVAGGGGARDEPGSVSAGGAAAAGHGDAGGDDVPDLPAAAGVQPAVGVVLPQPVAWPPEAAPRRGRGGVRAMAGRPTVAAGLR